MCGHSRRRKRKLRDAVCIASKLDTPGRSGALWTSEGSRARFEGCNSMRHHFSETDLTVQQKSDECCAPDSTGDELQWVADGDTDFSSTREDGLPGYSTSSQDEGTESLEYVASSSTSEEGVVVNGVGAGRGGGTTAMVTVKILDVLSNFARASSSFTSYGNDASNL